MTRHIRDSDQREGWARVQFPPRAASASPIRRLMPTLHTSVTATLTTMKLPAWRLLPLALSTAHCSPASLNVSSFVVSAASGQSSRLTKSSLSNQSYSEYSTTAVSAAANTHMAVDPRYPGTAVERVTNVHKRVAELAQTPHALNGSWGDVRRRILWAGGLRDLPHAIPGQVRVK